MSDNHTDQARIDRVLAPFREFGGRHYGEQITQYAHAVQCARIASEQGCSPALVAAALLHDIGQCIDHAGEAALREGIDAEHEETGARLLAADFPASVTEPVRLHVAAKRYLCATEPDYRAGLSEASELSLRLQGGPMTDAEVAAFRKDPHYAQAVQLRRIDDAGKRPDWAVPPLDSYRGLLAGLLLPEPASGDRDAEPCPEDRLA